MNAKDGLSFPCCYCRTELNESRMYVFKGQIGCENCIRDYYRGDPTEADQQLETRHRSATEWLERNRRSLERMVARRRA